ncbi:MAG: hypothetical protein EPN72_09765 [Nevskiaceae bacterium]|nr:MAG: hypothetical protein EPN63_09105 [Nevskiaceae bacterium]TBR72715.1 MAG: hypothetical protein EPN72_09765 [Nevskiaceae bacterium]
MKHWVGGLCVALAAVVSVPAMAQVGVSISVGQPGFYGQINLGSAPVPQLIYQQPVVVAQVPQYVGVAPIYLRVPPGYERHWSKHCAAYRACGRPVYFVTNDWYERHYVPYYREHRGHPGHGEGHRGHGHGYDKGHHGHGGGHQDRD